MISHHYDLDRFIPQRTNQTVLSNTQLKKTQSFYSNYIKQNICPSTRVLNFHNKENIQANNRKNHRDMNMNFNLKTQKQMYTKNSWSNKKITYNQLLTSSDPQKILDVPGTRDDFYLNTLDWSPQGPLGIALDNEAYLYTPSNITEISKIIDGSYISSLKFQQSTISLGYSDGKVRVYDVETTSLIRQIHQHQKRVSALSFGCNNIMYTGSKDRNILVNDLRIRDSTINRLSIHRGQICSLSCQPQIGNYLASGSNDNWVAIWDIRRHQLYRKYSEHKGAIKAIGWCPWKTGVIATAGGAGDKTIRLWNIQQNQDLALKRTQTQISSLVWNQASGLLISSHGHPNNEINFWSPQLVSNKALSLQKVRTLKGHTGRILNLAVSPSQTMLCSLSSDQTLRFWSFLQCEDTWKPKKQLKSCRWSLNLK